MNFEEDHTINKKSQFRLGVHVMDLLACLVFAARRTFIAGFQTREYFQTLREWHLHNLRYFSLIFCMNEKS